MKMFKKMAVLAAALMMVSVFVSCDNNAEESDAAVIAEFDGYFAGYVVTRSEVKPPIDEPPVDEPLVDEPMDPDAKVFFYDDNTFKLSYNSEFLEGMNERAAATFVEVANGTYEGDPSKDGKVKISVEEVGNMKTGKLEEAPADAKKYFNKTIEIKNGAFNYDMFYFERVSEEDQFPKLTQFRTKRSFKN